MTTRGFQAESERLRCNGDNHFARKEYSIAAECYKAAIELAPCDHNTWFNYAFSLVRTAKYHEAVKAYEMAIGAGSGAAAHNNLGNCYRKLGKNQEARDEFIKATHLEERRVGYWRNLAACLADLKETKAELNALDAIVCCEEHDASDWHALGCAREREGDVEDALIAFSNAAYEDPKSFAYYYSVAVMQDRSGRVLDAYHACRHALRLNHGYKPAEKMLPRLETAVKATAAMFSTQPTRRPNHEREGDECSEPTALTPVGMRDIGQQDYVNPYSLLNISLVSDPPGGLEWFDQPDDWDELIGSLTRRRRELKAELELNDGKLSWLPQLQVTDDVVHRVLSGLDDCGWHAHHWAVFRLPLLNRFLMHGDLAYFSSCESAPFPIVAQLAGSLPGDLNYEEFVAFVSPYFRQRWALAVKQAIDVENYAGASALFSTRAPISAADLDQALEPIRRHFARRREELKDFADSVESRRNPNPEPRLELAAVEAKLVNVLPMNFSAKLRDDMCFAYRNISIALANHSCDYAVSERALKAAESFQASATIKQRLAEDRTAVTGLLRRDQEEKRLSLRLTLKSWLRERILEITPERFAWGDESIDAEQMNGIRYGITIKYINGIKTGADSILALRAINGSVVSTDWLSEANFSVAVRSVMGLYASTIVTKILAKMEEHGCEVGQLKLSNRGITFNRGFIFTKEHFVPWADLETKYESGLLQIYSHSEREALVTIACREYWNVCLLPTIIEIMKNPTN